MPLLRADHLRVDYGAIAAIVDVSLRIDEGEMVALLGPNGAGKTTLLKALGGVLPKASGEVVMAGEDITGMAGDRVARRGISLVPEGRGIFPALSVEDNLRMGGYFAGEEFDERLERVTSYFPILARRRRQAAGSLSGGEQQQLAISRALMARPRLLMLDELSLGLAPLVVAELFRVLRQINDDGTAVLLVEQQVPQALALARRVYVLERGRITLEGTSEEVRADAERLSAAYLGTGRRDEAAARARDRRPDPVELERLTVPLSHRYKRWLQTLADRGGEPVGAYVARLIADHVDARRAGVEGGTTLTAQGARPGGASDRPPMETTA